MRIVKRSAIGILVAFLVLAALAPIAQTFAQDGRVTITLGVPVFTRDALEEKAIKEFEAANPNVHVQLVTQETLGVPSAANGIDAHLDAVQKLTSTADVVFVSGNAISPEATRAGYYLNLQPLIDSDKQINTADFYPTLLRTYQWDQGMWGLPLAADATILTYDPAAFDKAGIAYPTDRWTLDDLAAAVKALNVKDENGNVTTPGLELYVGNNDIPLYMSVLAKPLYDANAVPNPPLIDQPEVIALLDKIKPLQDLLPLQTPEFNTAPIRIESLTNIAFTRPNQAERKGVLLPGDHAYLDVTGIAVSGATQYPEQAYALARFLTTRSEVNRFTSIPARQSLRTQDGGNNNGFGPRITPELQVLLDQALASGYTTTDRRYYDYLSVATVRARTEKLDPQTAVAQVQSDALKSQQTALDRKTNAAKVAVIATPVPTADPNKGVTLKFGVTVFATSLPKKAEIEALAAEFVKANPGVAKIDIQNGFQSAEQATDKYDCFYLPYSAVPSLQLDKVLNLDPFLSADTAYDAKDYVGGAVAQVTRDSKIWALPMGISPTVMWFDPTSFANAGLPKPAFGWNVSTFRDTLNALKPTVKDNKPPFFMSGPGGEGVSMLMLIAAYGGLPIDWSSTPPVVKFTDKTNADAMRQVLDLAKAKLIDYKALGSNFGLGISSADGNPLYSEQLNGLNFRQFNLFGGGNNNDQDKSKFEAVPFPRGTQLQALSYSSGSLYISARAQNPDACYKWISTFAARPDLMSLMPVRNSQLADASLETTAGKALAAVYRDIAKVLDDPNTLKVPSLFDGGSNISGFVVQYWLFQAWDNYVLNDKDLDGELKDAQTYADAYIECAATIPAYDPAQMKYQDYIRYFTDCAVKADPRLKKLLGGR